MVIERRRDPQWQQVWELSRATTALIAATRARAVMTQDVSAELVRIDNVFTAFMDKLKLATKFVPGAHYE